MTKELEKEVIELGIETIRQPEDRLCRPCISGEYNISEKLNDKKTTQYDMWCRHSD